MPNIKLIIEYDGRFYYGWQEQTNSIRTAAGQLKIALNKLYNQPIKFYSAARIDAKAHAKCQVINFVIQKNNIHIEKLPIAINSLLPKDIIVKSACYVEDNFHARYSAKAKRYRYVIYNNKIPNVFYRHYAYFYSTALDIEKMNKSIKELIGEHNLSQIIKVPPNKSPVRNIEDIRIEKVCPENIINIDIIANSFLYRMARYILGILLGVGSGKLEPQDIDLLFTAKLKYHMNLPPAHGLYLMEVYY